MFDFFVLRHSCVHTSAEAKDVLDVGRRCFGGGLVPPGEFVPRLLSSAFRCAEDVCEGGFERIPGINFFLVIVVPLECSPFEEKYYVGEFDGVVPTIVLAHPVVIFEPVQDVSVG